MRLFLNKRTKIGPAALFVCKWFWHTTKFIKQINMPFNNNSAIKNFLAENKIYNLDKPRQLIAVVELVAKIPWGEGRTITDVLETKKCGTYTGKHLLLQACFDELEIEYRPLVCTFHWGNQTIKYPENLKVILAEGE